MIGQTLGHYRIDGPLGSGGMGAVYLATDLALGRQAAVKVVGDCGDAELRARLLREGQAGARLQHPAIATFYESGETDAGAYIAMEYVRGRTLRDRLGEGRLSVEHSVTIARALLEALHHAHAAGILHRDIKPENIMLTDEGRPKLLDFGLARVLLPAAEGDTLTNLTAGHVLGTFGYMAPEQLRGEAVDERTDLFALGAVLYEMIIGRAAFPGARPAERIAAILGRVPPIPPDAGVPVGLRSLIGRAVSRDPAARFASAAAMLSELRGLVSDDAPLPLPQSVAVVDLRNLSGHADNDWIGSGIAESLLIDLARLPGLTVIPREKVLRASREVAGPADPLEIGRMLGSRWVVSGSFQRAAGAVRITTTLSEVTTGEIAAAEKLDGSMDAIFELQDRLSRTVASSLNLRLPSDARAPGKDLVAFELHARGQRLWRQLEKGTLEQAGELYRRAIDIEPGYAPALSGLAALHAMRFTFTTDRRELELAVDYASRAIAADARLADPHVWLGYALMRQDRLDEALAAEQRAAALDPDHAYAAYFCGSIEFFRGRPAEAIPYYQRAVMIDPQHGFAWMGLASAHVGAGSFEEGRWCIERAIALEGSAAGGVTAGARVYLAECLRLMGDAAAARQVCLTGIADAERSDHMYRDSFRGIGLCVLGRTALQQGDGEGARIAFLQALAHVSGRNRTLGGGHLVVQALAGLARAGDGESRLIEAMQLFSERDRFNFSMLWTCSDDVTLLELARAADTLAHADASLLLQRALDAGSIEAARPPRQVR